MAGYPLDRRSFLAQVVGGAALAGGALALADRARGQVRPSIPRPMPPPTSMRPQTIIPLPYDNDSGPKSDAISRPRPPDRFRPCSTDSDSGRTADPRCRR